MARIRIYEIKLNPAEIIVQQIIGTAMAGK